MSAFALRRTFINSVKQKCPVGVYEEKAIRPKQSMKRAFTLIELLVVIAIIGILASLLLPVLVHARNRAQGTMCLNNGRQMILALTLYFCDNPELFPPHLDH